MDSRVSDEKHDKRAQWMGCLARADETHLKTLFDSLDLSANYHLVRGPEEGLVMVRGRAAGVGERFNMGETTVTRCSIELESGIIGHAYIAGRKPDHAERAALIDALMLQGDKRSKIEKHILKPLVAREIERQTTIAQKALATRVDFFTMVRGED